jgi:HPt (histidine-containing phosphotransfer) domain-containing protein
MDDYLSKPVRLADLQAMLEKWLPASEPASLPPLQGEGWGGDGVERNKTTHPHPNLPPEGEGTVAPRSAGVREPGSGHEREAHAVPLDVNVLKALIGDDEAVIRDFLHDFRASAAKIAAELKVACGGGQAKQAGALAHKLKSSARSVGALALGELCAAMEQAGKAGDMAALAALLHKFEQELAVVNEYLDPF